MVTLNPQSNTGLTADQVKKNLAAYYAGTQTPPAAPATVAQGINPNMNTGLTEAQVRANLANYNAGQNNNTQAYTEAEYNAALAKNPIISQYVAKGNTVEGIKYAAETGDLSGIVNQFGQPFSIEEQQAALKQAETDNAAYYDQLKAKETTDTERALAEKQAAYQDYLLTSGQGFEKDKATLDQTAANQGVLFSGARAQKEKSLQKAYEQEGASKLGTYGRDVAGTAQDFQYKYGNEAAKGLSQYYQTPSNTYNPNVATGGVGSTGLSNIYNPSTSNYAGTRLGERAATANQRATGLLTNKANKLLASGYSNKL